MHLRFSAAEREAQALSLKDPIDTALPFSFARIWMVQAGEKNIVWVHVGFACWVQVFEYGMCEFLRKLGNSLRRYHSLYALGLAFSP